MGFTFLLVVVRHHCGVDRNPELVAILSCAASLWTTDLQAVGSKDSSMSSPADVKKKNTHGHHHHGQSGGAPGASGGGQQNKKPKIEGQSRSAEHARL